MMRLFIAIPLPDDIKAIVKGVMTHWQEQNIKGSYVSCDQLHITLAFLGDVDEAMCIDIMKQVPVPKVSLTLGPIGHFRDTYYISCLSHPDLTAYVNALRTQFARHGVVFSSAFIPHITFARRIKKPCPTTISAKTWPMTRIVLYNSVSTNGRYVHHERYVMTKEIC